MLFIRRIEELVETCMWTGFVKNEKPVSLLLVAPPESGKSEILLKYCVLNNPPMHLLNDFTVTGVRNMLEGLKEEKITHIVCPDFIKIISRKLSTVQNLTTMLNSIIEEGIIKVELYNFTFESKKPVKCGLMTAMTPKIFFSKKVKSNWNKIGLTSRVMVCSWKYTKEQVDEIFNYIKSGKHANEVAKKIKFPKKKRDIILTKKQATQLEPIARKVAKEMNTYGFRLQKGIQTLAKARALMRGSKRVSKGDINDVLILSKWLNLECNEMVEDAPN